MSEISRQETYHITFGDISTGIASIIANFIFLAIFLYLLFDGSSWAIYPAILFGSLLYFVPTIRALDVKDRIPGVEGVDELKDERVRHSSLWMIIVINILFGFTFIGWVIAFFWAHSPGTVVLTPKISEYLKSKSEDVVSN